MGLLVVRVPSNEVELASDWLWSLGCTAIEESSDVEGPLTAGFRDAEAALAARDVISQRWPARVDAVPDESTWRDVWLQHLAPVAIGDLTIHPPWVSVPSPEGITITIDPGHAFGSGHHPTTQLAVQALLSDVKPGMRVLDVGCGTGVLAIVAARLGAEVTGVDLDHDILDVAILNAEANDVGVEFHTADVAATLQESFDLVIANMTIGELRPVLPHIVTMAGDILVLSGLLAHHADEVDDMIRNSPYRLLVAEEWVSPSYRLTPEER